MCFSNFSLVSTPSIFFSLSKECQDKSYLFDIDDALISKHKNGRKYDFNWTNYDEHFSDLKGTFDFIVIDPPFITEEAWSKFASFAKYLSNEKCKILVSSIVFNNNFDTIEFNDKLISSTIKDFINNNISTISNNSSISNNNLSSGFCNI